MAIEEIKDFSDKELLRWKAVLTDNTKTGFEALAQVACMLLAKLIDFELAERAKRAAAKGKKP